MLIMDNFIHADLHPGNVLVRMEDVGWLARLQRYLVIGQTGARVRAFAASPPQPPSRPTLTPPIPPP